MANEKLVKILKQGGKAWNEWYDKSVVNRNSVFKFDLKNADFSFVDLSGAMLYYADLEGAIFRGINLRDAILINANLANTEFTNCDLTNSKFSQADLYKAVFSDTIISQSDFSMTSLKKASFVRCKFNVSNFERSYFYNTIFALCDSLSNINFDSIAVGRECSIDFQTLQASKNLPKTFLRKIGLPENYINYLPDFFDEKPIRMHPAFLSHSWQDKPFATKLYEALIKRNVLVWYDERKLVPGDDIREGISKGIDLYDKFILVCSKNSLKESWWVDKELNRALDKELRLFKEKGKQINTIIPITIDDYVHQAWDSAKRSDIQRYVIGDFRDWQDDAKFEKALDALVAALNADRGAERVPSYL